VGAFGQQEDEPVQRFNSGGEAESLSIKQPRNWKDSTFPVEGGEGSRFLDGKYRSDRLVDSLVHSLNEMLAGCVLSWCLPLLKTALIPIRFINQPCIITHPQAPGPRYYVMLAFSSCGVTKPLVSQVNTTHL
jgi:hypothetical protein